VLAAFIGCTAAGLLTYPPYYEDESWTYLAAFEALRGNGFTWAAFGDGSALAGVFYAIVTPALAILPATAPEAAVRIVTAMWGVAALTGAFIVARRLAPSAAWIAPALMFATPYVFVATRYGRIDVVALALALWSIAAAARDRPLLSGLVFGIAASVHPLLAWAVVPCLWLLGMRDHVTVLRFATGVGVGAAPQVAWMLLNRDDVTAIVGRYAVSSSLGAEASGGIVHSVAAEPRRYVDYLLAQSPLQRMAQLFAYVALPLVGLAAGTNRGRLAAQVCALWMPPVLTLAVLSQNKNPYYLYTVLPFAGIASACAMAQLPRRLAFTVTVGVVGIGLLSSTQYVRETLSGAQRPTPADATAVLSDALPRSAVVIAPNYLAGIIRRRPDVDFFNYHALSGRPGWHLPACAQLRTSIAALIDRDSRIQKPVSATVAYVVAPSEPALAAYLKQIYVNSTVADAHCLLSSSGGPLRHLRACTAAGGACDPLVVAPFALTDSEPR
jgi:hypothetical protein